MKKIFLILALFLPFTATADRVSQEQARKIAETFLSVADTRGSSPALTLKWTGGPQTRADQDPAFFAFDNATGGFIIISGDDCVEPILGYSTDGEFRVDDMPDNVKYWFDFLQEGIAHMRANHINPSAKVRALWHAVRNDTAVSVSATGSKMLNTALWNQGEPFNLKATEWCGFGEPVYTGCVATAAAIIMRYFEYPSYGTGTIGGYSYQSESGQARNIRSYSLGHIYDWNNMPTDNGNKWNITQQNAVAQLMLDCGVMSEMDYGTLSESGSSASISNAVVALVEHMGYDKGHEKLIRDYFTRDEWVSRLIDNIDRGLPVYFSGRSEIEGHAFILDGFDSDGRIHINWGWGGHNNAFYTMPDFGAYLYQQAAFLNIKPDAGGSEAQSYIYQTGLKFSNGPVFEGETVSMTVFTEIVGNGGSSTYHGKIYLAHADKENNIKKTIREINAAALKSNYVYSNLESSYTVNLADIASGDKIKWFYLPDGNDAYLPVRSDLEDPYAVSELPLPETEDRFDIEKGTSAEYFPGEKTLVISSHPGLRYQLKNSGGSSVSSGIRFDNGVLTIDLAMLDPDTYTLTLMVGQNTKELKFTIFAS